MNFALEGPYTGWLGLGVASTLINGMTSNGQGSDIMVGWIGGSCTTGCVYDYWATVTASCSCYTVTN